MPTCSLHFVDFYSKHRDISSSTSLNITMVDTVSAFGRGSAVGKLLHTLYHKPTKPSTFDADLAAKLKVMRELRELEAAPKPKVVPKSRAKVKVPRLTGRRSQINADGSEIPRMPAYYRPNRRPENIIKAEMQADPICRLPPIHKKFISPEDKQRFQTQMEFNGEIPEPKPPRPPPAPVLQADLSVHELFDEILEEIEERKLFLEEMKSMGRLAEVEAKIKQEISQRVQELKKLDRIIKAETRSLK